MRHNLLNRATSLLLALVLAAGLLLSVGPFASAATRAVSLGAECDPFSGHMTEKTDANGVATQ